MSIYDSSEYVTAGFDTLVRQASMTASEYMRNAVTNINDQFGDGYAQKHPELVAAFMNAASVDMAGAVIGKTLGHALPRIAESLDQIAEAVRESD
jgi:hypothetical protein